MNIRLYHAQILSMKEGQAVFPGEVWIQNETIRYVGKAQPKEAICRELSLPDITWEREIDCGNNLLMPGFKDAHVHSGMTLMRSLADDLPLDEWLNHRIFPIEAKLTAEDIYELTRLAVLEYLTSGITAVFDMYLTPQSIADAYDNMGMRGVQVGAVNNFSQSPDLVEEMYQKLNHGSPLQSYLLGFHAEYTCSRELLEQMAKLAHKYQAPVFTHLAETKGEVEGCMERYKMTPMVFLDSLGMFDYGGGGYHCVHMSPEDISIMREKKLFAVTNPASNLKLASGIAPISEFLKEGVQVAIGTDGPASNNCLDMFREMFLVTALAKVREQRADAADAAEVLKMATVNGAHAMGLWDADILAEGKKADLIMIDLNQPNMQPVNHIPKNLVYSGSKQNVLMTMIHGRILYEKGQFYTGGKPEEIYAAAERIKNRIL